jgi:hypothetical protein
VFQRLKRPGYWIVLLALLTVYFYHAYQKREEVQRREAMLRLFQTYGEEVLGSIREGNLTDLQRHFRSGRDGRVSLEDIALFVSTLHLDRNPRARWESWEEREGNVTLHGKVLLEDNASYPMDMMVIKRGDQVLLNRLRVGPRTLELRPEGFPFDAEKEQNLSPSPKRKPKE